MKDITVTVVKLKKEIEDMMNAPPPTEEQKNKAVFEFYKKYFEWKTEGKMKLESYEMKGGEMTVKGYLEGTYRVFTPRFTCGFE